MYTRIVEGICRKAFEAVNRGDHAVLLGMCRPDVTHRFGGNHALGGTRHTRDGLALWFERLDQTDADHTTVTTVTRFGDGSTQTDTGKVRRVKGKWYITM